MSKFMTYDYWIDTYQPKLNTSNDWGGDYSAYETYGPELDYVSSQPNNLVWTEVDGDEGIYLISGMHYVNRIQYFVCAVPWDDDMIEIPVQVQRACDCNDEGEGNDDCPDCQGYGYIDIDCDTVEDLQAIYGRGAEIVG